jgi:hypothetical protein
LLHEIAEAVCSISGSQLKRIDAFSNDSNAKRRRNGDLKDSVLGKRESCRRACENRRARMMGLQPPFRAIRVWNMFQRSGPKGRRFQLERVQQTPLGTRIEHQTRD